MAHLTAVSSTARDLFLLLRCIGFSPRALVQISDQGLRFSVEESRVMQGLVVLDKSLFTSYRFEKSPASQTTQTQASQETDDGAQLPTFSISLVALLETLQIFGFADIKERFTSRTDAYASGIHNPRPGGTFGSSAAFDSRVLGMTGLCRLSYSGPGSLLCITLEEGNVTTTCELMTYEPETIMGSTADDTGDTDIPFDRNTLTQKVIMRASLLHEAIAELASSSPERLTIISSPKAPYFSLSAIGPLGSTTVDFNKDAAPIQQKEGGGGGTQLLETFQVAGRRVVNTYKFSMIRAAAKAMAIAEKISIRTDAQGVLSLQFMVQLEGGHLTFVDFKFVPFVDEENDGEDSEEGDGEDEYEDTGAQHETQDGQ